MKLYPTTRATQLLGATILVAFTPIFLAQTWFYIWLGLVICIAIAAIGDLLLSVDTDEVEVSLRETRAFYLGEPAAFEFAVRGPEGLRCELRVDADGPIEPTTTQRYTIQEGDRRVAYRVVPNRRGTIHARAIWLRWKTRLGLFQRSKKVNVDGEVLVLPNIEAVKRGAVQWSKNNTFLTGVHTQKYLADGSEFEALRKYVQGMDHRAIDWKASAKHHKLLNREFRAERNQPVIIAFDTGRLMSESIDGLPKIDHAINAGLLLGYMSLRIGDRVGMMGFDERVRLMRKPVSGVRAYHQLTSAAAMLDYSSDETNFTVALSELATSIKRRSIIVVFTDFTDTIGAELMLENMYRLARRHIVLFVAIRNPELEEIAQEGPNDFVDMTKSVLARQLVAERTTVLQELGRRGVFCVDATPSELHLDVLNSYLEIHRRELV